MAPRPVGVGDNRLSRPTQLLEKKATDSIKAGATNAAIKSDPHCIDVRYNGVRALSGGALLSHLHLRIDKKKEFVHERSKTVADFTVNKNMLKESNVLFFRGD